MPITFSSPRAQPEVVYFLISNESPYFSDCKSKISASNSLWFWRYDKKREINWYTRKKFLMYFHNSLIPRGAYFLLPLESKQEATSGWNFTKCISEVKVNQLKVKNMHVRMGISTFKLIIVWWYHMWCLILEFWHRLHWLKIPGLMLCVFVFVYTLSHLVINTGSLLWPYATAGFLVWDYVSCFYLLGVSLGVKSNWLKFSRLGTSCYVSIHGYLY